MFPSVKEFFSGIFKLAVVLVVISFSIGFGIAQILR